MTDKKDDGGSAFPTEQSEYAIHGMSLRDWFAGRALAGIVAQHLQSTTTFSDLSARQAYEYADAMLAARTQGDGE